jgi:hypothetical protein
VVLAVVIVSDADDVGAGAWLGSAELVADEVGLAGSWLGDAAESAAGRSLVMLAMAMSTTATSTSPAAPPAIHRLRPIRGWSGSVGAVTGASGLVAAGCPEP